MFMLSEISFIKKKYIYNSHGHPTLKYSATTYNIKIGKYTIKITSE